MDWSLFPRGVLIGFTVALPIGPMAVLCMRRTLTSGHWIGFVSGLGIASADAIYSSVAAFGLTTIATFLIDLQDVVRLVGGVFLCYLGYVTVRSQAAEGAARTSNQGGDPIGAYVSTLGLTLANPPTILAFAAIFSGLGAMDSSVGSTSALALVIGVFVGSSLWWLTLTTGTSILRNRMTVSRLTILNRVSGFVILTFGIVSLVSLLR